jgi:hypothetical protein
MNFKIRMNISLTRTADGTPKFYSCALSKETQLEIMDNENYDELDNYSAEVEQCLP